MTKHIHRQIVIAFSLILTVCIALTVSFYIFSRNGAQVQHEEAAHSLEATAETARNIVNSHIQGNLQTLVPSPRSSATIPPTVSILSSSCITQLFWISWMW